MALAASFSLRWSEVAAEEASGFSGAQEDMQGEVQGRQQQRSDVCYL